MKHESLSAPPASPAPEPSQAHGPRWTPRKMADFLRALAATHSVKEAARSVGMSRQSAHRLRSRLKGMAFDAGWDQAFRHSYDNLPFVALERALNGTEVPHYYKGELIGTSRRYDERLTVALLKMISSEKVLLVSSDMPGAEARGRRFETLASAVEAEGEFARDPNPTEVFAADSANVSPWPDEELMEELRALEDDEEDDAEGDTE